MPCSGSVGCDEYEPDEGLCIDCGCEWDLGVCFGEVNCSSFGNMFDCENCGCNWTVPSTNIKINIGDAWRDVSEMKINIADVWRTVTKAQINIGDAWRTVFG